MNSNDFMERWSAKAKADPALDQRVLDIVLEQTEESLDESQLLEELKSEATRRGMADEAN